MWYVLIFGLLTLWVGNDAIKRKLGIARAVLWALGTFFIGVIVIGFYIAHRPLKANEIREGGYAWNVVKGFALSWSVFVVTVALMIGAGMENVGAGVIALAVGIPLVWLPVMIVALILGYFLRNPAIVERGPTGPLAQESRVV